MQTLKCHVKVSFVGQKADSFAGLNTQDGIHDCIHVCSMTMMWDAALESVRKESL